MKIVINTYHRLSHLELGVRITIDDIKKILPDLAEWQAQVVLARLAREHDEGVFMKQESNKSKSGEKKCIPQPIPKHLRRLNLSKKAIDGLRYIFRGRL